MLCACLCLDALSGFIHRRMTSEQQRVADISLCVSVKVCVSTVGLLGGRGGKGGEGAIKDSAPLAVLLWR